MTGEEVVREARGAYRLKVRPEAEAALLMCGDPAVLEGVMRIAVGDISEQSGHVEWNGLAFYRAYGQLWYAPPPTKGRIRRSGAARLLHDFGHAEEFKELCRQAYRIADRMDDLLRLARLPMRNPMSESMWCVQNYFRTWCRDIAAPAKRKFPGRRRRQWPRSDRAYMLGPSPEQAPEPSANPDHFVEESDGSNP